MTLQELAKLKFYEGQSLSGPEPGRLTWEECLEMADPANPLYADVYENLKDEAFRWAVAECN